MLDSSPLINNIIAGNQRNTVPEGYIVNGVPLMWMLYMLSDVSYPERAIFVLRNHAPLKERDMHMTQWQEGVRRVLEKFFGCLQGRLKIMRHERHEWSDSQLILICRVCFILHNMIVKMASTNDWSDEQDENGVSQTSTELLQEFFHYETSETTEAVEAGEEEGDAHGCLSYLLERDRMVCNRERHIELTEALSHHLWKMKGRDDHDN